MDEQNVHHFWGISPAVDLLAVEEAWAALRGRSSLSDLGTPADQAQQQPVRILQAASYDARHTITTLCRLERHRELLSGRPVHLYVYEEEPEVLARHLLQLSVLLDASLLGRDRVETLLEVHGNALVRDKTAAYLEQRGRQLEALLVSLSSGAKPGSASGGSAAPSTYDDLTLLAQMLDISMLRFQDRDRLVEAFLGYRQSLQYDMVSAWDARARKWYGDRYDARRNMVDWDYHMRMAASGTPGQPKELGSIIHFHHFRHWRMHGVAHELRDARYSQPNRSLLSTAYGRAKEFMDRNGRPVGRSVSARGYWGDCLNSPYHAWGTLCEDPAFYQAANKQFTRTAVDVAEHNLQALLHELRTGERPAAAGSCGDAHRARAARGPTSLADLQQESSRAAAAAKQAAEAQALSMGPGVPTPSAPLPAVPEEEGEGGDMEQGGEQEANAERAGDLREPGNPASGVAVVNAAGADAVGDDSNSFHPSAVFQGRRPGFSFRWGHKGQGYYRDLCAAASVGCGEQAAPEAATGALIAGTAEAASAAAASLASKTEEAPSAPSGRSLAAQAEAVRAAEAALDTGILARLGGGRVRLFPLLGAGGGGSAAVMAARQAAGSSAASSTASDMARLLTARPKFAGAFHVASVGHRHVHLLGPDHKLAGAAAPGALLVVEGAQHLLQLRPEQAAMFSDKILEAAKQGGWGAAPVDADTALRTPTPGSAPSAGMVLTDAHLLFCKP